MNSPFRIAVINDEISPDFGHACEVVSKEFGMQWIELRSMWKKNLIALDAKEIAEARSILEKNKLRVTDIGSPLFKVDWPGAPHSKFGSKKDQFNAEATFQQQDEVLERCIALAKAFNTNRIRCFDFWRLEDPAPYRAAMNAKLREAAKRLQKHDLILLLENEMACNTGTGHEAAKVLADVTEPNFMLNWDPGNAGALGEKAFPEGYALLPKNRIGHCHVKSVAHHADGTYQWQPVGQGDIDWVGQFRALKADGYKYAVSLETHWHGAATPEESTRISWAGMKKDLEQAGTLSA